MNKKYTDLIQNTLIFSLGSFGSKLILFFLVPLYTHYMTTDEYGIADLVFTVAQFLIPFMSVVIYDAVIRFGLAKTVHREDVLRIGYTIIAIDCLGSFLMIPAINLYAPLAAWKWYLSAYLVASIMDAIQFNYLKVCNRNKLFAGLSIFKTFCMAGLNVILIAWLHTGIRGYLLSNILALSVTNVFVFILGHYKSELQRSHWNGFLAKEMLWFSAPLILNNISWWFIQSADKVLVEYMMGAAALGVYTVAAKIPALINVIISIFSQAWGISSITEYESTADTSFYSIVQKVYIAIVCAACIGYVSVIKIFMGCYVSAEYQDAWQYVPLLLVSAVFSSISSFYGSIYGALKKSFNNMLSTFFSALTNVSLAWLLIPMIGIWGAILGTVFAYGFIAMYRMIDVRRFMKIQMNWHYFFINCVIIIGQALFVSLDIYANAISVIAVLGYCLNNKSILVKMYKVMKLKIERKNVYNEKR